MDEILRTFSHTVEKYSFYFLFGNFHFYTPPANVRKALLFSCEYCEIVKNTYFKEYLRTLLRSWRENALNRLKWMRRHNRCFPVNIAKTLWRPFFTEQLRWLLLTKSCLVFLIYKSVEFISHAISTYETLVFCNPH